MLKKEFIAGMVTGAIAFGGTGAAAAGLLAQPSAQSIYVNGQPVYCTAYAISGNIMCGFAISGRQSASM